MTFVWVCTLGCEGGVRIISTKSEIDKLSSNFGFVCYVHFHINKKKNINLFVPSADVV